MAASEASTPMSLPPHPGRRRDKPQLSCHTCRQRKRKCDRQQPCSYCLAHHLEQKCSYAHELGSISSANHNSPKTPEYRLNGRRKRNTGTQVSVNVAECLATPSSLASDLSLEDTDLHLTKSRTSFKDPTHWSSILNDATQDKGHKTTDANGNTPSQTGPACGLASFEPNILLFQGCKPATHQELVSSMPSRRECDGLVSFYFKAQEYRSVIHPTEFLKKYNAFWTDPGSTPIAWLGFLYSILCLATQAQSRSINSLEPQDQDLLIATYKIFRYREKVVQCLVKGQFAKGGPDILETLLNYVIIENFLNRESPNGVWLLIGNIVQIAMRMGYHRDPQYFKSLSPYQGEMRRRMWAWIYFLDMGFSTQMGLPGNIKHALTDTMPPRNLQDRDFDANVTDLPPARPMTELTSSTVTIAKLHVASTMGIISDIVNNPHPLSYEDLVAASSKLDATYATIPEPCKLRSMSDSLLDPPSLVFQRVNFYMLYQRARILVNWKFLGTSIDSVYSGESWKVVTEASMEVMRLQHQTADETDVLDEFRPTGLIKSCFINNGYFLAASVACYNLRHRWSMLSSQDLCAIRALLEKNLAVWDRTKNLSRDALKVVAALRDVLGLEQRDETSSRASMQAQQVRDIFDSDQLDFAGYTPFFDDLPMLMTDADATAAFPLLPLVPDSLACNDYICE